MADKDFEIVRGTFTAREKGERVHRGPGSTIKMDETDAERFVELGHLVPAGERPKSGRGKSPEFKAAEARIIQLEGELKAASDLIESKLSAAADETAEAVAAGNVLERALAILAEQIPDEVEAARKQAEEEAVAVTDDGDNAVDGPDKKKG